MQPGDFRIDDATEFLVKIVMDFIGLRANAGLDHFLDQMDFKVIGDFLPSIICRKFTFAQNVRRWHRGYR